jgi:hypothetical protein
MYQSLLDLGFRRWNRLSPSARLFVLATVTVFVSILALISLLSQFNVSAILYKGF